MMVMMTMTTMMDDDDDDNANIGASNVLLLSTIFLSHITASNVYTQDEVCDKKCVRSWRI